MIDNMVNFCFNFMLVLVLFISIFLAEPVSSFAEPILTDPKLDVEEYVTGLNFPTTIHFVDEGILVLQKNDGKVLLIKDGVIQADPALDVEVSNQEESGMLGITSVDSTVFLYYTESENDGGEPLGNRIYKYEWDGKFLKNPILVKDLPTNPQNQHNGGIMVTKDNTIFAVIGDQEREGLLQNMEGGKFDDTGVILQFSFDDEVLHPSKSNSPKGYYYAMGIRNSFGLAFDPITGYLWDTENGSNVYDEINLVEPKFNSGWNKIMGPATESQISSLPNVEGFNYSDPEFSWEKTVTPTALIFVNSELLSDYQNKLLVGTFNSGEIYEFDLNESRTGFVFSNPELNDFVFDPNDFHDELLFGASFGGITDIKLGPDGLLYVVSMTDGVIYRIFPSTQSFDESKFLVPNCSEPPQPFVNWSGCILKEKNLENVNLTFANLTGANFEGANLQNAILTHANLVNADLSSTNLQNATITFANLHSVKLSNANLKNSDLSYANLQNTKLFYADLENANLKNINLQNADLSFSNLEKAKLYSGKLAGANLTNANLLNADLTRADLEHTIFRVANLNQTKFVDVHNVEKADFAGAYFYKTEIAACFGSNFIYNVLRLALTEVHDLNFILLQPIEWVIPKFCPPHYYIEPIS